MLNPGDLTERVALLEPIEGDTDAYGRRQVTWRQVATLRCRLADSDTGDVTAAGGVRVAADDLSVETWDRSDVAVGWRLRWLGDEYEVEAVARRPRPHGTMTVRASSGAVR